MTLFTVHIPVGARDPHEIADEMRLVPEKASFGAFLLGPIWLVAQGARLAAGAWVVAMAVLVGAVLLLDVALPGLAAIVLLIQLFIGLEGHQLARTALSHGRFEMTDVVKAASADEAEHVALARIISESTPQSVRPAAQTYMRDADLPGIGLFPGAGG